MGCCRLASWPHVAGQRFWSDLALEGAVRQHRRQRTTPVLEAALEAMLGPRCAAAVSHWDGEDAGSGAGWVRYLEADSPS